MNVLGIGKGKVHKSCFVIQTFFIPSIIVFLSIKNDDFKTPATSEISQGEMHTWSSKSLQSTAMGSHKISSGSYWGFVCIVRGQQAPLARMRSRQWSDPCWVCSTETQERKKYTFCKWVGQSQHFQRDRVPAQVSNNCMGDKHNILQTASVFLAPSTIIHASKKGR